MRSGWLGSSDSIQPPVVVPCGGGAPVAPVAPVVVAGAFGALLQSAITNPARHFVRLFHFLLNDVTNAFSGRNDAHASLAHEVKSIVRGPVAKSFNLNFANLYDEIDKQRARPGQFYAAEDDAKAATETLIRDAGYEPLFVGGLDMARKLEDEILGGPFGAVMKSNAGPFFYRYAKPGEL